MITIDRSKWNRVTINGKVTARVVCPGCGLTFALSAMRLGINEDGTTTDVFRCPIVTCITKDILQLERWEV